MKKFLLISALLVVTAVPARAVFPPPVIPANSPSVMITLIGNPAFSPAFSNIAACDFAKDQVIEALCGTAQICKYGKLIICAPLDEPLMVIMKSQK